MRIDSTVNSTAGAYRAPKQSAGGDSILQNIEKQIGQLEEQKQEIAAQEDMPTEIKMERQNQISEQIAQLRQQLFARRRELQQEKMEVEPAKQPESDDSQQPGSMSDGQMFSFAQAGSAMTQIKAKEEVRTSLNGEAKKLKAEISLDESRGLDVTDKLTALSAIEYKIGNITEGMAKDMAGAVKSFDDAAEQKAEDADDEEGAAILKDGQEQSEHGGVQTGHVDAMI